MCLTLQLQGFHNKFSKKKKKKKKGTILANTRWEEGVFPVSCNRGRGGGGVCEDPALVLQNIFVF